MHKQDFKIEQSTLNRTDLVSLQEIIICSAAPIAAVVQHMENVVKKHLELLPTNFIYVI